MCIVHVSCIHSSVLQCISNPLQRKYPSLGFGSPFSSLNHAGQGFWEEYQSHHPIIPPKKHVREDSQSFTENPLSKKSQTLGVFLGNPGMHLSWNQDHIILPETNSSHLKIDPWKRRFVLETIIFGGYVSFGGVYIPYLGGRTKLVWAGNTIRIGHVDVAFW